MAQLIFSGFDLKTMKCVANFIILTKVASDIIR